MAIIGLMIIALAGHTSAWAAAPAIPDDLEDLILESPVQLKHFELINHRHQPFNIKNLEGKWTFIFFGYTHCPDICPTTLAELNTAAAQLAEKQGATNTANNASNNATSNDTQFVFVSVDSARDTIDELAEYISYFNKDFVAVTGLKEQLTELTTQLGVKFEIGDGTPTLYFVSHASAVLLIDPQARYYARFKAPHYSEVLISGLNKIRDFHQLGQ